MGLNLFFGEKNKKNPYAYLRSERNSSSKKKGPVFFKVKPAVELWWPVGVVEVCRHFNRSREGKSLKVLFFLSQRSAGCSV